METNLITLNTAMPTFKNKDLNTCTEIIFSAAREYNQTAGETRKAIASSLNRIEDGKLYKDDDCKSLAEYASRIGLDKSLAHKLENAGRMINSKDETIRQFALAADWSKLAIMASAGEDAVKEAITSGAVKPDSTQAEVKSWKTAHNASKDPNKPKVVPTWRIMGMAYHRDTGDREAIDLNVGIQSPADWAVEYDETAIVASVKDKDGTVHYMAMTADGSMFNYTATKVKKEAAKPAKPAKPDFSTLDAAALGDLLKAAIAQGVNVAELLKDK